MSSVVPKRVRSSTVGAGIGCHRSITGIPADEPRMWTSERLSDWIVAQPRRFDASRMAGLVRAHQLTYSSFSLIEDTEGAQLLAHGDASLIPHIILLAETLRRLYVCATTPSRVLGREFFVPPLSASATLGAVDDGGALHQDQAAVTDDSESASDSEWNGTDDDSDASIPEDEDEEDEDEAEDENEHEEDQSGIAGEEDQQLEEDDVHVGILEECDRANHSCIEGGGDASGLGDSEDEDASANYTRLLAPQCSKLQLEGMNYEESEDNSSVYSASTDGMPGQDYRGDEAMPPTIQDSHPHEHDEASHALDDQAALEALFGVHQSDNTLAEAGSGLAQNGQPHVLVEIEPHTAQHGNAMFAELTHSQTTQVTSRQISDGPLQINVHVDVHIDRQPPRPCTEERLLDVEPSPTYAVKTIGVQTDGGFGDEVIVPSDSQVEDQCVVGGASSDAASGHLSNRPSPRNCNQSAIASDVGLDVTLLDDAAPKVYLVTPERSQDASLPLHAKLFGVSPVESNGSSSSDDEWDSDFSPEARRLLTEFALDEGETTFVTSATDTQGPDVLSPWIHIPPELPPLLEVPSLLHEDVLSPLLESAPLRGLEGPAGSPLASSTPRPLMRTMVPPNPRTSRVVRLTGSPDGRTLFPVQPTHSVTARHAQPGRRPAGTSLGTPMTVTNRPIHPSDPRSHVEPEHCRRRRHSDAQPNSSVNGVQARTRHRPLEFRISRGGVQIPSGCDIQSPTHQSLYIPGALALPAAFALYDM